MVRKPRKSRRELTDENVELHKRLLFLETAIFGMKIPNPDTAKVSPISWAITGAKVQCSYNNDRINLLLEHLKLKVELQPEKKYLTSLKKKKNNKTKG